MHSKKFKKQKGSTRRDFLGKAGLGLLAGYAFVPGMGLAKTIKTPNHDRYQSITLNTHEWFGDIEERLDLPKDWDVNMIKMAGHDAHVLTPDEIRNKINNPVGTKRLSDIAYGKKTAVITFDDLTRPTPVGTIAPYVIEELKKGGIKDEDILFVGSHGNHRLMSQIEVKAKLGEDIVDKYPWISHNVWENVTDVGVTSFGNRIAVNYYFMKADVKVCISGVKTHGFAGYGGGGKAVLPGVASFKSTYYNHVVIRRGNETAGVGKLFQNEVRLDMEEAARLAGVDFTVQIVYSGKREPVDIFAGETRQAHIEACKMANKHYVCQPAKNADIVINNTYPQTKQGNHGMNLIMQSVKEGGSGVLILQNPMCLSSYHYLGENLSFRNKSYWDNLPKDNSGDSKVSQIIIFSQYLQQRDRVKFPQKYIKFAKTWEQVLELLEKNHKGTQSVAVYPYGQIQHQPFDIV